MVTYVVWGRARYHLIAKLWNVFCKPLQRMTRNSRFNEVCTHVLVTTDCFLARSLCQCTQNVGGNVGRSDIPVHNILIKQSIIGDNCSKQRK